MLRDVMVGVISTMISAVIVSRLKSLAMFIEDASNSPPSEHPMSKKKLYRQFIRCFFTFAISFALAIGIHGNASLSLAFLKIACGLIAGMYFLFTWGCFDAAFAFYPPDDVIKPPANDGTNDATNNDR